MTAADSTNKCTRYDQKSDLHWA